jgi:hypothetical protein
MPGKVEFQIDADDLIRVEEDWTEDRSHRFSGYTSHVVYFLGVEVGRYREDEFGRIPEEFTGRALEARQEKLVRALWALGDPN